MCKPNYGKCSKILNTFIFLCSNKVLVLGLEFTKKLLRIANREGPDRTASSSGCALLV